MTSPGRGSPPTLELEHSLRSSGISLIAGVDEVGRGSWAGPVVAAAVILDLDDLDLPEVLRDVRDSKLLSPEERAELFALIRARGLALSVGWATHHVVDLAGLGQANRRAMIRAVQRLPIAPHGLVLDHVRLPELGLPQVSVPRADARSLSVAASSIVAKVVRDRWMAMHDARYPGYGFASHKGYGTPEHRRALAALGPCRLHRRSFAPVAASAR